MKARVVTRSTFSIRIRIESSATGRVERGGTLEYLLSVSAFGSNHLQPTSALVLVSTICTFSIRIRIESSATCNGLQHPEACQCFQYPHSDRIICNTTNFSAMPELCFAFQYPHSDRIICNSLRRFTGAAIADLSVSAFGSNHLQRRARVLADSVIVAFSIRIRIESSATALEREILALCYLLSVSAFGSNHLQRTVAQSFRRKTCLSVSAFGSNHLQPPMEPREKWTKELSVSAFGSNHLQLVIESGRDWRAFPFSIRIRIESSATPQVRALPRQSLCFQYPHSDRIICNRRDLPQKKRFAA